MFLWRKCLMSEVTNTNLYLYCGDVATRWSHWQFDRELHLLIQSFSLSLLVLSPSSFCCLLCLVFFCFFLFCAFISLVYFGYQRCSRLPCKDSASLPSLPLSPPLWGVKIGIRSSRECWHDQNIRRGLQRPLLFWGAMGGGGSHCTRRWLNSAAILILWFLLGFFFQLNKWVQTNMMVGNRFIFVLFFEGGRFFLQSWEVFFL